MWITQDGLRESITDKNGTVWFFAYWHDWVSKVYTQRILFWDADKKVTGLLELKADQAVHLSKWKDKVIKLTNDKKYRQKFIRVLKFPIDNVEI